MRYGWARSGAPTNTSWVSGAAEWCEFETFGQRQTIGPTMVHGCWESLGPRVTLARKKVKAYFVKFRDPHPRTLESSPRFQ